MSYNTNAGSYITKELFLLLKKGKNAFPMERRLDAGQFDTAFRSWFLSICQIDKELSLTSPDAQNTFQRAETVEELQSLRRPIDSAKEELTSSYQRLLQAVASASAYIPNPVLSTMFSTIGLTKSVNQYYKQVHEGLKSVQDGHISMLDTTLERIDRKIGTIRNAQARATRERSNAAAQARNRAFWNAQAAKAGLPAGTPSTTILEYRRSKIGGKRKTHRRKSKQRKTRRRA